MYDGNELENLQEPDGDGEFEQVWARYDDEYEDCCEDEDDEEVENEAKDDRLNCADRDTYVEEESAVGQNPVDAFSQFDRIYCISEDGIAGYLQNDKFGYIDVVAQKVITPAIYDDFSTFLGGYGVLRLGEQRIVVDKSGKELYAAGYDIGIFKDGLACVDINEKIGYISPNGEIVIPPIYDSGGDFNEGLAKVKKDGKWGHINTIGEVVIPLKYESADSFVNGFASVKLDGKWGFIDKSGKEIIPFKYDSMKVFSPAGFTFAGLNDKYGVLSADGVELTEFIYTAECYTPPTIEYGYCSKDFKQEVIDNKGKTVVPLEYDWAFYAGEGFFAVEKDGKWGYLDKKGKEVIPLQYNNTEEFSDGLAAVSSDAGWGYINTAGEVVIPFQYEKVGLFRYGVAPVKYDGKWRLIDKTGKHIILDVEKH